LAFLQESCSTREKLKTMTAFSFVLIASFLWTFRKIRNNSHSLAMGW